MSAQLAEHVSQQYAQLQARPNTDDPAGGRLVSCPTARAEVIVGGMLDGMGARRRSGSRDSSVTAATEVDVTRRSIILIRRPWATTFGTAGEPPRMTVIGDSPARNGKDGFPTRL